MNGPSWFDQTKVKISLDARPLLAQGIHPLEQVMKEASGLGKGEIFEIVTPFPPAPMIEKMAAAGYDTYSVADDSGLFRTWFHKS